MYSPLLWPWHVLCSILCFHSVKSRGTISSPASDPEGFSSWKLLGHFLKMPPRFLMPAIRITITKLDLMPSTGKNFISQCAPCIGVKLHVSLIWLMIARNPLSQSALPSAAISCPRISPLLSSIPIRIIPPLPFPKQEMYSAILSRALWLFLWNSPWYDV